MKPTLRLALNWTLVVCALGYFVDVYDLVLFGIVRVPSLKSLGLSDLQIASTGVWLLDLQMAGMLVGGFVWGILGDSIGRTKALFGSILLYSLANLANGFASSIEIYGVLRFLAGMGLAGELGAAVTLVTELLPLPSRGLGSVFIGLAGFLGAITAALLSFSTSWRMSYIAGGALGLMLLLGRLSVRDSEIYQKSAHTRLGWVSLFRNKKSLSRYTRCFFVGVPVWFISGLLLYFSPEFARALGVEGAITTGQAILWTYAGSILGDIAAGFLSQRLKSRKRTLGFFLSGLFLLILGYPVILSGASTRAFYGYCFFLGVGVGYWTLFVAMTAEQFGTQVRATASTSVANLVRAVVIPLTTVFVLLKPRIGDLKGALVLGTLCSLAALLALASLPETFHKNLDYIE